MFLSNILHHYVSFPIICDVNPPPFFVVSDETFDIRDNTYKELTFKWEGFNYLLREDEKNYDNNGYLNAKRREETLVDGNDSFLDASDSSDGVVLNYTFNQNDHSLSTSSNLSEEHYQFIKGCHKDKNDCNVIKSDFSSDKLLETSETASVQSEFDAVMKTLNVQENSNKSDNKSYDCNSYNDMTKQESPNLCDYNCTNISQPNRCLVGRLAVEPLCKTRTGKFNILAFVLQVCIFAI